MEIIQHDKTEKKFFMDIKGQTAELTYAVEQENAVLNYYRTFVPPELRGRNIGEKIVIFALEYAKENHYQIIPSCPFVERIIARHPQYKSLVVNAE